MNGKKIWVILNPKSGGGITQSKLNIISAEIAKSGNEIKLCELSKYKDAGYYAASAAKQGITELIVCGGDGTIRGVLKESVKNDLIISIIPVGTGNIFARNLNIPTETNEAIQNALNGEIKKIDLGEANGNFFAVICSMGIDVDVMTNTSKNLKSKLGISAYIFKGIQFASKKRDNYRIIVNNKREVVTKAKSVSVTNLPLTGVGIELDPEINEQSGNMTLVLVKTRTIRSWINLIFHAFKGNIDKSPYYDKYKVSEVDIYSLNGKRKFECDGETFPATDHLKIQTHSKILQLRTK